MDLQSPDILTIHRSYTQFLEWLNKFTQSYSNASIKEIKLIKFLFS